MAEDQPRAGANAYLWEDAAGASLAQGVPAGFGSLPQAPQNNSAYYQSADVRERSHSSTRRATAADPLNTRIQDSSAPPSGDGIVAAAHAVSSYTTPSEVSCAKTKAKQRLLMQDL